MEQDRQNALNQMKALLFGPDADLLHAHDLLGIDHAQLEAMYVSACRQLAANQPVAAGKLYCLLAVLDHDDPKHWRGLAVCAHRLKVFPLAELLYNLTLRIEPGDAVSRVYRAEIMLNQGRTTAAWLELEMALEQLRGQTDPMSLVTLQRAEALMQLARTAQATAGTFESAGVK
ncbi:MAG: hypothetical protein IT381_31270 [Deltaproteobacteria bacterium]|nr:hypothetical protein [Deltaproteobacteria bacterium]